MEEDAKLHAEEDRKRKELVEARNQADNLIYNTEKSLNELGDKVDAATRQQIQEKADILKKAVEGEDVEKITSAQNDLMQASHKLAEMMYQQTQGGQQAGGAAGGTATDGAARQGGGSDDDVVDADFEEVK
jgi:molecular chaperone DnaK